MNQQPRTGIVVIGRNEGERLARCLASIRHIEDRVYVDSGSTDGSLAVARREGAQVVELAIPPQFTAARARNAGLAELLRRRPDLEYVQMVDGDCEVQPEWLDSALRAIRAEPGLALVFGRRRERFPERSVYNALCDDEWNLPVGEAAGCGGDALFRVDALRQVDFYNPAMIAGEDSELSMRLRKKGWRLRRIDAEMTLHDAAITRFSQFWQRTRRAGHGYAEMASLHPDARDPDWPRSVRSILFWGGFMPVALLACSLLAILEQPLFWLGAGVLLIPWPLRMAQLYLRQRRRGLSPKVSAAYGALIMIGKVPQCLGVIGFYRDRWSGKASSLIEYKSPMSS
jgi:cellulose synthase/poly-beta-1,6-N-acetylglucosamine synthase-like glycosyltransferase